MIVSFYLTYFEQQTASASVKKYWKLDLSMILNLFKKYWKLDLSMILNLFQAHL